MENIISKGQKYFYKNKACKLIQGNSLEVLKNIKPESIDMIIEGKSSSGYSNNAVLYFIPYK